ncbi:adenosine deaminase [Acidaminobacter sp. JC074]|uniref:adenosine deaminase n=1 Tax=Acidaminobacter sp. JC074 TaxID=2530199 RepID=UPI001F0FCA94|nr:adenosine deaminase [Acidaminobacter sp. JC074]MCH4888620.1 adenosine deaminase [Acidaminobacter sp. JC074]
MNYKALPKIDLHCHLDGSARPETLRELAVERNLQVADIESLRSSLIAPESCPSLDEYLKRFELAVQVMQDKASLERIAYEIFEDASYENVKYLEVRFGPLLHMNKGLNLDEIISSVLKGMNDAKEKYDIEGGIIIAALRTMPTDRLDDLIETGSKYLDKGLVGFDLASSEVAGFCDTFKPFVEKAKALGYKITIHAGETGVGKNVFDAVTIGADRIGHGIHIHSHQKAFDIVKKHKIVLETCPSSNVQTKAVTSMENHPIKDFMDAGILVTINTDNRTVSNTSMTKEVKRVMETFNLDLSDYHKIYEYSVQAAFTSDEIKEKLLAYIR